MLVVLDINGIDISRIYNDAKNYPYVRLSNRKITLRSKINKSQSNICRKTK